MSAVLAARCALYRGGARARSGCGSGGTECGHDRVGEGAQRTGRSAGRIDQARKRITDERALQWRRRR